MKRNLKIDLGFPISATPVNSPTVASGSKQFFERSHSPKKERKSPVHSLSGARISKSPTLDLKKKVKMHVSNSESRVKDAILPQVSQLHRACTEGDLNIVLELLQKVHIDAIDERGRAAIHFASVSGDTDVCDLLIRAGANVNLQDINGNTPLHLAVVSSKADIVVLLLENGAKPSTKDKFDRTAFQLVESRLALVTDMLNAQESTTVPLKMIEELKNLIQILIAYSPQLCSSPKDTVQDYSLDIDSLNSKLQQISTTQDVNELINNVQDILCTLKL